MELSAKNSSGRWVVLALAWLGLLLSFVDRLAWSSVAPSVSAERGVPLASLGGFASAFFAGYVISNLIGGTMVDRFGSRRGLSGALLLLGLFTIGFGFTRTLVSGLVLQGAMGLAAGADYAACIKLIAAWFAPLQRARAIGILMTSLSLGVIVDNAILPAALHHVEWPAIYWTLGGITVALGLGIGALLRDAPEPRGVMGPDPKALVGVLRNPELARLAIVGFAAAWGTWGFAFWATALMSKGAGLSLVQAGLATSLFGAAAIFAKPIAGAVSDWTGGRRKALIVIVLGCYTIGLLGFGLLKTPLEFQLAAVLLGLFGFSWGPLLSTLIAEIGGSTASGTATGTTNAVQQLGGVFVPVAIASVFGTTHSFFAAFIVMAAGPAVACIVMWVFCHDADYAGAARHG